MFDQLYAKLFPRIIMFHCSSVARYYNQFSPAQVVDFALMFLYAPNISRYYIQIEDDVRCANGFVRSIERFLHKLATDRTYWAIVDFSSLGFIGKLLRSTDLRTFAHFLLLFYQEQPVDFLINQFRMAMAQGTVILCKPTLFQHLGLKSTLQLPKSKDNTLKDKYFLDDKYISQLKLYHNPAAVVLSSMTAEPGHHPQNMYDGRTYFWAQKPLVGSTVDVTFSAPIRISRVTVITGDREHPKDTLQLGVLEACTSFKTVVCPASHLKQLGQFVNGSIDANVRLTVPVYSLRVRITHAQDTWIIFHSISVHVT